MTEDAMVLRDLDEYASKHASRDEQRKRLISSLRIGGCVRWAEFLERALPIEEASPSDLQTFDDFDDDDDPDGRYVMSHPEDLLFELIAVEGSEDPSGWDAWEINEIGVGRGKPGDPRGALCYESAHGMGLEDLLMDYIPCPGVAGWHVVEGVTGHYSRGDGWSTDDDMEFHFPDASRPATPLEISDFDMVAARGAMAAMQQELETLRAAQASTPEHRS